MGLGFTGLATSCGSIHFLRQEMPTSGGKPAGTPSNETRTTIGFGHPKSRAFGFWHHEYGLWRGQLLARRAISGGARQPVPVRISLLFQPCNSDLVGDPKHRAADNIVPHHHWRALSRRAGAGLLVHDRGPAAAGHACRDGA